MTTVRDVEDVMRHRGVRYAGGLRRRLIQAGVIPTGTGGRNGSGSPRIDRTTALHIALALMTRNVADLSLPLTAAIGIGEEGIEARSDISEQITLQDVVLRLCSLAMQGDASLHALYVHEGYAEIIATVDGATMFLGFGCRTDVSGSCRGIVGDVLVDIDRLFGGEYGAV